MPSAPLGRNGTAKIAIITNYRKFAVILARLISVVRRPAAAGRLTVLILVLFAKSNY